MWHSQGKTVKQTKFGCNDSEKHFCLPEFFIKFQTVRNCYKLSMNWMVLLTCKLFETSVLIVDLLKKMFLTFTTYKGSLFRQTRLDSQQDISVLFVSYNILNVDFFRNLYELAELSLWRKIPSIIMSCYKFPLQEDLLWIIYNNTNSSKIPYKTNYTPDERSSALNLSH